MRFQCDEIVLQNTAFWVGVRGRCFGPFDYEWSCDLHGIELTYQGQKFGEICGPEELFADLAEFKLPISICKVAAITAGILAVGVTDGACIDERVSVLIQTLNRFGFGRFQVRVAD